MEITEIVMSGQFSTIYAVQLAEFQGSVCSSNTPCLYFGLVPVKVFLNSPGATNILQHNAVFVFFTQEKIAQEGDDQVGGDEVAQFVDKGDAVGVTVKQQTDVAMLFLY